MKLKMTTIVDKGNHNSEKVLIDVLEDADLDDYIVRDTTYTNDNKISNKWSHAHKFAKQNLKQGDKVVLWTKKGKSSEKDLGDGKKEYTRYWGLDSSVWNNDGDAAVLYELNAWHTLAVNSKK